MLKKPIKNIRLIIYNSFGLQKQMRWNFENYGVLAASVYESTSTKIKQCSPAQITIDSDFPLVPCRIAEGLLPM